MEIRKHKWVRRVIIIVVVLVVLLFVAGVVVGNMMYNLALNPDTDKSAVTGAEHNQIDFTDIEDPIDVARRAWEEEVTFADWSMESEDGLQLHSYALEQGDSDLWAILCHGYTSEAEYMTYAGYMFYQEGCNLLMPDARGHGQSEGDYIGMGWDERRDIVGWIDEILARDPDAQIVLYGVSMGGGTVMMVSGEELPSNVKAIVEDCGYTGIQEEFSYQLKMLFGLPEFPVMHFSSLVTRVRARYWLGDGSALDQVKKSTTPMLFIHGNADTFVPSEMVYEVYEAADVPKDLLVVEGAGHGGAAAELGQPYRDTLFDFVGEFLD